MVAMTVMRALKQDLSSTLQKVASVEKDSYRYWRIRILYASILTYAAFYLVRANFSFLMPSLQAEFGYSKTQVGIITSYFAVSYGVGKFINGYFSDRSDARYFITIGLLASAVVNALLGLTHSLFFIGVLWTLNGWFQSMGWPPSARMLTHWFSPREIGTKWGLWASSHQLGAATIAKIAPFLILSLGWQMAFYGPAVLAALFAVFAFNRLRDRPSDLGFPSVEEYKENVTLGSEEASEDRITAQEVFTTVLCNKWVWFVGMANLCLYIPRMGIFVWAPSFLTEFKGFTLIVAGTLFAIFELAGLVGGILAGWLSDTLFEGRRGPVGAVFLVLLGFSLFGMWKVPPGHFYIEASLMILSGFFVYGPQVLVGIAAADFASKRAVGVATGVTGTLAYAGSGIAGGVVGHLCDIWGWDAAFILFIATSFVGAFFFSLTWNKRSKVLDQAAEKELQAQEAARAVLNQERILPHGQLRKELRSHRNRKVASS